MSFLVKFLLKFGVLSLWSVMQLVSEVAGASEV